ncbi:MAG: hypothetical protein HY784_15655 [Chloroflexi bacterium]|nr:hypothetical protein [Chloroflexota bacterium]
MKDRPAVRTQFLIFTLFGEYIQPHSGGIWLSSLLHMLGLLDVTERAARSTLSRMARRGWLRARRAGRHSQYWLTAAGATLILEASERIFEPRSTAWDGRWHLLVYSIPENKRALRDRLRKRLAWLGFGRLAPATWISAHPRQREVQALLDELQAGAYAHFFSGLHPGLGSDTEIVRRCWDLDALSADYCSFLQKYQPLHRQALAGGVPDPATCFVQRFWLTHEFAGFPRRDPNLPPALLPSDWQGGRAGEMMQAFRTLLHDPAEAFVERMLTERPG